MTLLYVTVFFFYFFNIFSLVFYFIVNGFGNVRFPVVL